MKSSFFAPPKPQIRCAALEKPGAYSTRAPEARTRGAQVSTSSAT